MKGGGGVSRSYFSKVTGGMLQENYRLTKELSTSKLWLKLSEIKYRIVKSYKDQYLCGSTLVDHHKQSRQPMRCTI